MPGVYGLSIRILAVSPQGAGRRRPILQGPVGLFTSKNPILIAGTSPHCLAAWFGQQLLGTRIRQAISGVASGGPTNLVERTDPGDWVLSHAGAFKISRSGRVPQSSLLHGGWMSGLNEARYVVIPAKDKSFPDAPVESWSCTLSISPMFHS